MFTTNYLTLHLVRLKPSQEWSGEPGQLSFVFPTGGQGSYVSGVVKHHLTTGDVLVEQVNGAPGGKIGVAGQGELTFWCFSVCVDNLFPLFAADEVCLLPRVTDGFKKAKLLSAPSPSAVECHRLLAELPPQTDLVHRSQLLRIAAAVLSKEFQHAQREREGSDSAEEQFIQEFENLSAVEILNSPIDELAEKFSCSRRHLCRLFHSHFGMSVATMRMEMRLLKAVSLLRNPDAKIINVAADCGFNHLGLFNNCFKKRFGNSPGQWRKSAKAVEGRSNGTTSKEASYPMEGNGLCSLSAKDFDGVNPAFKEPSPLQRADFKQFYAGNEGPSKSIMRLMVTTLSATRQDVPISNMARS